MKIYLICNAGMSTGVMKNKLEAVAKDKGVNVEITAIPLSTLESTELNADVYLLGPQIRFAESEVRKVVGEDAFIYVMTPTEFGLMQVEKIWDKLIQ